VICSMRETIAHHDDSANAIAEGVK